MDAHAPKGKLSPPPLSRQTLLLSSDSTICAAPDGWSKDAAITDLFEFGGFYEIEHEQLPPKSPIHLKDIRVVKVTEITRLNVTVNFPSVFSLRKYLVKSPVGTIAPTPPALPQPDLDEQFVMGFNHSGKILRRLIPSSEVDEEVHLERFWLVASRAQESVPIQLTAETQEEHREEAEAEVPESSCLLALKSAGLIEWGVRRKVKYIGRHREENSPAPVKAVKEEAGQPREGCRHVGRKRVREIVRNRKRRQDDRRFKRLKRVNGVEASDRKVIKATKDRWSTERYEAAELKLLKIMKLKGAAVGNPILRPELREEARKHIGDTGLLDHLLKHMAGKVVSGGSERFRRRHNPEGAMEYWLEPAELQDMQMSAGVMDPFWFPPCGWNAGDPITPYGVASGKEIEHLKEELASLRRDIERLRSLKDAQDAQSRTEAASILKLQDGYETLARCNAKLEEQVAAMATCLQVMQEEMRLLKLDHRDKREAVDGKKEAKGCGEVAVGDDGGRGDEKTKSEGTRRAAEGRRANDMITNISGNRNGRITTGSSSGGRTMRRSGFRICKPQGTFLWPNMGGGAGIYGTTAPQQTGGSTMCSSPSLGAVPTEDPSGVVPPTPNSASSATSPPRRASPVAPPRAPVVVVVAAAAARPHNWQQTESNLQVSGERTDSSDNTCAASLPQSHTWAPAFTQYGGNLETCEPGDGHSDVGWSTISTDLALSYSR